MDPSTISAFFNGDAISNDYCKWTSPNLMSLDRSFCDHIETCYHNLNYSFWSPSSKYKVLFKMLMFLRENCWRLSVHNFNLVIELCVSLIDREIDTDVVYQFLQVFGEFWKNVNLSNMEAMEYQKTYPHMCDTLDILSTKLGADIEQPWSEIFLNEIDENWEFQNRINLILSGILWVRVLSKENRALLEKAETFPEICSRSINSLVIGILQEQNPSLSANCAYKSNFFLQTTQGFTDEEVRIFCLYIEKSRAPLFKLIEVFTKHVKFGKYTACQKRLLLETIFQCASTIPIIYSPVLTALLDFLAISEFPAEVYSCYFQEISFLFQKRISYNVGSFEMNTINYNELAVEIDRHLKILASFLKSGCCPSAVKDVIGYLSTRTNFDASGVDYFSIFKILSSFRKYFSDFLSEEIVNDFLLRLAENAMNCFLKNFNSHNIRTKMKTEIKNSLGINEQWIKPVALFILNSLDKSSLCPPLSPKQFENFAMLIDDSEEDWGPCIKEGNVLLLKNKLILHAFCLAKESNFSMRVASLLSFQYESDVLVLLFEQIKSILDSTAKRADLVKKILYLPLMLSEESLIEQEVVGLAVLIRDLFSVNLEAISKEDVFEATTLMMASPYTTETYLDFSIKLYQELFPDFFANNCTENSTVDSYVFSLNCVLNSENTPLVANRLIRNVIRYIKLHLPITICEEAQQEILVRVKALRCSKKLKTPFLNLLLKSKMITGENNNRLVSMLIRDIVDSDIVSFEDLKNVIELVYKIQNLEAFVKDHKSEFLFIFKKSLEFNISIKKVFEIVESVRKGRSMNYISSFVDKVMNLFILLDADTKERQLFYLNLFDAVTHYVSILEVSMVSKHGSVRPLFIQSPSIRKKSSGRTNNKELHRFKIADSLGAILERSNRKIPLEIIIDELTRELAQCNKRINF